MFVQKINLCFTLFPFGKLTVLYWQRLMFLIHILAVVLQENDWDWLGEDNEKWNSPAEIFH